MSVPRPSDEELMEDLRRGRPQALGTLYDRYGRLLYRVARRILHDDAEGEDLVQEIFLEIYRKAGQYDFSKGSVRNWLLQYGYHRSFNRRKYLALRRFYDEFPAGAIEESEWAGDSGGRDGLSPQEWQHILRRGLQELNGAERAIVESVAFDGLTVREASERAGQTYMNGRNLYYRGLKKLREFLRKPAPGQEIKDVRS